MNNYLLLSLPIFALICATSRLPPTPETLKSTLR
jgi:hypothetical protein